VPSFITEEGLPVPPGGGGRSFVLPHFLGPLISAFSKNLELIVNISISKGE
jgi:hypothetical protein